MFIVGFIEAKEESDVMTLGTPNNFLQTTIPTDPERTIMNIRGTLVEILIEISLETRKDYVAFDESKNKMFFISMLKPSCDMMKETFLHCE